MKKSLAPFQFFQKWAGFSRNPDESIASGRARCAHALVQAEKDARAADLVFVWEYEENPDVSWMDAEQTADYNDARLEMLSCYCFQDAECGFCNDAQDARRRHGKVSILASLGGVSVYPDEAGRAYRRVVEAELAQEAIENL